MINFVIVDDFKEITDKIEDIISKIMMKNKMEYKTHVFHDYDSEFKKFISEPMVNRIYLLDIETKSASGIDFARLIRKNDLESIIIFITAHEELAPNIVRNQLMVLTFICKFDDFETRVKEAIYNSLNYIGKKRVIKFIDNNAIYIIPIQDILYVTHDNVERKCLIKATDKTYKIGKSLTEIKELSNGSLNQCHRGCLVNEERIVKFDRKRREITFDTGEIIDIVSENYKLEVGKKC